MFVSIWLLGNQLKQYKMSTRLFFQDDSIELIEIASSTGSTSNLRLPHTIFNKLKKNNRVCSPPNQSPNTTSSSTSHVSDIFTIQRPVENKKKLLPPLQLKDETKKYINSSEISEQEKFKRSELDTPSDKQSVFSTKSETLSYKDKLRNRFLTVKKQAVNSAVQYSKRHKQKVKLQSVDVLEKENDAIDLKLEKYYKIKRKLQLPQNNTSYDFFCKEFVENSDESEVKKFSPGNDIEIFHDDGNSFIELLSIDQYDSVVETLPIECLDLSGDEKCILWLPFSETVDIDRNVDVEPRSEDDGIYIEKKCFIPPNKLTLLEKRLYIDNSDQWFDRDGKLILLPDPRSSKCYKPLKNNIKLTNFITDYIPPSIDLPSELCFDGKILEFILYDLHFMHHPLFSIEHVLVQKLKLYYNKYNQRKESQIFNMLQRKLDTLLDAKNRLENNSSDEIIAESEANKLQMYFSEIYVTRENIYKEGKKDRDLIKSILNTWKAVKKIRNIQKYSSTSAKLVIKKTHGNYESEKELWEKNIDKKVIELSKEYENEMEEYNIKLKEWRNYKKNLKPNEDMKIKKPVRPNETFDIEEIKLKVREKHLQSLKPPGEPFLDFDLQTTNEITIAIEKLAEKNRRNAVNKTQMYIRLLYNKQEICKSKIIKLNDSFVCNFNETISIQLYQIPNALTMEIYEQTNSFTKNLLTEISLAIPDLQCDFNACEINDISFTQTGIINFNHDGVGNGINLHKLLSKYEINIDDTDDISLFNSGNISYILCWNLEDLPHEKKTNITPRSQDTTVIQKSNLDSDFSQNELFLDPQNPETHEIGEYFRLDPGMKPLEFCSSVEIESNVRFKLLKLRDDHELEFHNMIVPNRIKEISNGIFSEYEKRLHDEKISILIDESNVESVDAHRAKSQKYLQQIENKIIQLTKSAEKKISLKDVLVEDSMPTMGSLGLTFMKWLQPKRPLRPTRKSPKKIPMSVPKTDTKIIVNIICASQIPVRRDIDSLSSHSEPTNVIPLRPFITVQFQDMCLKTTVAEGSNPTWNQELIFPLTNLDENMQNYKESLSIQLFDEIMIDLIEDDRLRDTNIHKQLCNNWLGGIEIPYATLYYNNRIEGTFKINSPPVLIGYEHKFNNAHANLWNVLHKNDTYLTVFITLQPAIGMQHQLMSSLECNELPYIEQHITEWQKEFNTLFPLRQFSSLVANINGETSCITRYIKPLKPPVLKPDDPEITLEQCVNYVSIIPFRYASTLGTIPEIWLSAEQLVTLMVGAIRDHAVLLTCYFTSLHINCWLVVGYGMPHGNTMYVLTRENIEGRKIYFVYDVESAQKYSISDHFCPLQRVYCLVNDENVWANIQSEDRLHLTRFDLNKQSDWRPLFGRSINAPVSATHQSSVTYIETPPIRTLQEHLESKLKKKIMKWRKHTRTVWNHHWSSVMRQILPKLEASFMEKSSYLQDQEYLTELNLNAYHAYGFALNFPYSSTSKAVESVRHTGIHCSWNPDVEFAVAAHVHPYPNRAVRAWLFVLSLYKRR